VNARAAVEVVSAPSRKPCEAATTATGRGPEIGEPRPPSAHMLGIKRAGFQDVRAGSRSRPETAKLLGLPEHRLDKCLAETKDWQLPIDKQAEWVTLFKSDRLFLAAYHGTWIATVYLIGKAYVTAAKSTRQMETLMASVEKMEAA
jgi:hypothetical protein